MQAKRIKVAESNDGAGGFTSVDLLVPGVPREMVNFHNIWASITVEPQDMNANAQGTWIISVVRANNPGFIGTDVIVNDESNNPVIIACGVWGASNESPYNFSTQIKTSRNLNPGEILRLQSTVTGITAGLASNRVMLCAHTVRA